MPKVLRHRKTPALTLDQARELIISGLDYAAYSETDFSLYDADKNRLFGSEHYNSGRPVYKPSPWAEGDFEKKMATLLYWAGQLSKSNPQFKHAQKVLMWRRGVLGRIIRRNRWPWWKPLKTLP